MSGQKCLVLYHPTTAGRIDTFHVDPNGALIQKSYQNGSWGSYSIMSSCLAGAIPEGAWFSDSEVHVFVPGSNTAVRHWWYDGSSHSETL